LAIPVAAQGVIQIVIANVSLNIFDEAQRFLVFGGDVGMSALQILEKFLAG
jgi:hypothetical protein